jgi:predicted rRNA methylase YqxC with S4 and FtsJ domains
LATLRFRASEADRLDRVLAARPEVGSRGLAERLILAGAVVVDGEPRAKSFRLEGGEEINVELP